METTETEQKNQSDDQAFLVIFGKDESNKAHAAQFTANEAELAIRAAASMAMKVLRVTSDEHREVASGLPKGRIFESGKAFAPFVKMAVYDRLNGFEGVFEPPVPIEVKPEPLPAIATVPTRWEDIGVGTVVLANDDRCPGWFEAVVVEAKGDGLLVLEWRDYPEYKDFHRTAQQLALLPEALSA